MTNKKINLNFLNYIETYNKGINEVGGKAYSIAVLNKNKINVPKGIVLPKQVWQYIEKNDDKFFLENLIQDIVNFIGAKKYVVRSSAIGEDSCECSWAGCFESILNIDENKLAKSIIECGNSLYGERVKAYRKLHNNVEKIKEIGILIQEYIDADWSGVCFSANPVTGNDNECIIEYQKGKSGSVVGGYGEPITLIINKGSKEFREKTEISVNNINLILKSMDKIYDIWKVPVDIEWVIKNNVIYITQARPITTV